MKKFKVIEIRKNQKGEEFVVESVFESESIDKLEKQLKIFGNLFVDKKYRIKEIQNGNDSSNHGARSIHS